MSKLENLVVIDVETSGLNPLVHDVLAIAFVPVDRKKKELVVHVRHSDISWNDFAKENFENFRADWVVAAVDPDVACEQIESYLHMEFGGRPVVPVGHNIGFDLSFLKRLAYQARREGIRFLGHRAVDTHTLLFILYAASRIPFQALSSAGAFQHFRVRVPSGRRHTALGDARATRQLLEKLLPHFGLDSGVGTSKPRLS